MLNHAIAKSVLKQADIRITPQRLAVIDVLVGNTTHPTVDQVFDAARRRFPLISLATVYNTIATLIKHGLIVDLHPGKAGLRCDANCTPHAHAYCTGCGALYDLHVPHDDCWGAYLPAGFQTVRYDIMLFGLCADCIAQQATEEETSSSPETIHSGGNEL